VTRFDSAGSALAYSTYVGGSGLDRGFAVALDSAGNAFVTGDTTSADFPVTAGSFQSTYSDGGDAFVVKLAPGGATLAYSTFLGGVDTDQGLAIALDGSGSAHVAGFTRSSDFPTLAPVQESFGGGMCGLDPCSDAFVTKMNATGTALTYSTFLGGGHADVGEGMAVDSSGDVFVVGSTASENFPATSGAVQVARGGTGPVEDAFIARINPLDTPGVTLAPQELTFADQPTGTASDPRVVTLTNSGSLPLTISSIVVSGDFAQINTCGPVVAAGGASCTISVTFNPTETGTREGTLSIADDAAGSPQVVALTGEGVEPAPAVTISPESLEFAERTVDTTSDPQTVTLTNSGSADLSITEITVGADFAQTNDCGDTVAPQAACTITVTFTPTTTGALTGAVSITDNAVGSPHTASVSGTGVAVFSLSATETSVTVDRGTDSSTFSLTVNAPSSFTSSVSLACSNSGLATCEFSPESINPGQSSTLTLSGLGQITAASLNFSVDGTSDSQTASIELSVLFADFTLSVSPTFTSIAAGQAAIYTLTVTPTNGFTGTVTFGCSFFVPETTCSFEPASVELGGSDASTAELAVQTTLRTSVGPPPSPRFPLLFFPVVLAMLATLAYAARRRQPRMLAPAAAILLAALLLLSCSRRGFVTIRGTPSGTFAISIFAVSDTSTQGTTVTLTVN
jgi:hypothetical protein